MAGSNESYTHKRGSVTFESPLSHHDLSPTDSSVEVTGEDNKIDEKMANNINGAIDNQSACAKPMAKSA